MRRFQPEYWTVNSNVEASAALTTPAQDALTVALIFRSTNDLVGLIWECDDTISHPLCRYESAHDFSGAVLEFDFEMVGVASMLSERPPTFTVEHLDGSLSYVRPAAYATDMADDGMSGHIKLEFSQVGGGWEGTEPVDWTSVKRMFLSLIPEDYELPADPPVLTPLAEEVIAHLSMSNISVEGPDLFKWRAGVAPHRLGMTDGYDDSYHLAPKRIVDAAHDLGYRGWYNVYIGLSHHHAVAWSESEERFIVDIGKPIINSAARAWWDDLVVNLVAKGFEKIVVSVSYEIIHYLMPTDWYQRDHAGAPGESGWDPPSRFISPCRTDALDYLAGVANYLVGRIIALGGEAYFQIGEPWWWDNSYVEGGGGPCFYDYATLLAYNADTGLYAPMPYLTSVTADFSSPEQTAFVNWLGDKLGQSTNYIRDAVKTAHPAVKTAILVYTPQVFSYPMLEIVNLPISYWEAPEYDVLQIEDYDWVIGRDWARHATTWDTAFTTLGYTPDTTQFFSGFNKDAINASTVWPAMFVAIRESYQKCSQTYVWARPQIWRDRIIWQDAEMITVQGD
ncbi:non-contractile tail sheath protein [Methylocystis rosea]|uniref:Uncharacterized protein n=1 Tax=Methylocystis rosea TaxID=173366 RepID=A0A3G8MAF3_9HYPH|nr:hypothetical protein [Methylocystis rosea]AZG78170.1 hypothetical protein EHO51_16315 [Methylocystis rosea]